MASFGGGNLIAGPQSRLEVRARRQLSTPETAEKFAVELREKLEEIVDSCLGSSSDTSNVCFVDFDLSQNKIPYQQWELIFSTLGVTRVRIQRARFFGCATLDDSVCVMMAEWIRSMNADTLLEELHLSDCAITADGFNSLMEAFEENENYPATAPNGSKQPLYVRLENNYIDKDTMQAKIDMGTATTFQKGQNRGAGANSEAKIKILMVSEGDFKQHAGDPPPPEDAAPLKQVWNSWQKDSAWSGSARNNWSNGPNRSAQGLANRPPLQFKLPGHATSAFLGAGQATVRLQGLVGAGQASPYRAGPAAQPGATLQFAAAKLAAARIGLAGATPLGRIPLAGQATGASALKRALNFVKTEQIDGGVAGRVAGAAAAAPKIVLAGRALPKAVGRAAAGSAVDRSRTPAKLSNAQPPAHPPAAAMAPHWEEHYSDEYNIPFFWNSETGESAWERPLA